MLKKPEHFEELEREFEKVLNEMLTDENMERFRVEYEKLHNALVSSHESELRLMGKIRELNNEIAANAEKVATALRMSKEDEATISNLKQESEKAWKMVDYLQEKELWSRETITALKQEITNLNELVQKGADLAVQFQAEDKGYTGIKLQGLHSFLENAGGKSADDQEGHAGAEELLDLKKQMADHEAEESKLKNNLYQLGLDLRNRTLDLQRERSRRSKLETDLTEKMEQLNEAKEQLNEITRNHESLKDYVANQEQVNKELRITTERQSKEIENLNARNAKLQAEVEKQLNQIDNLTLENMDQNSDIKRKEDKISKMTDSIKKLSKSNDILVRKVKILTEQRSSLRKEKEKLFGELQQAEKTIEANLKSKEADAKHISNLMRERDVFNKNLIKQVHATERQANLVSLHEQTNRTMGHEIMGFRREAEKQRRLIHQLERERDRLINDNGDLTMKVMKGLENIQMRDMQILDFQKRTDELESRLKIQQNLYEAVHQDRNMYCRQLVETQDEMSEMKNKLRVLEHQSHQLKEEVAAREAAVVKEHLDCLKLEKERDAQLAENMLLKNYQKTVERIVADLRAEEKNLQKVIANSDEIIKRQKRELDQIISERDILGSQLVRRNDELSLLYQKTRLLQTLINNGNKAYDERIEDIRVLRLEVKRQRHQNKCLRKNVSTIQSYKEELYSVHREVLHERARCAALENELSRPRQIHRWRGLEVSDPSKFELLQKVQALQKRLIGRTEEVVEVEKVLQEKDRLYLELRKVLERQPGLEAATQLCTYQRVLKNKNRQLKGLVAEMNMIHADTQIQEYDLKKMELQTNDLKKKYFKEKKKRFEDQQKTALLKKTYNQQMHIIFDRDVFTGGGFKVSQPP